MPYDKRTQCFVPIDFRLSEDNWVFTCLSGKSNILHHTLLSKHHTFRVMGTPETWLVVVYHNDGIVLFNLVMS